MILGFWNIRLSVIIFLYSLGGFQDEESNKIYLRVPDPGFLYFACDILQSTIEATKIQTSE